MNQTKWKKNIALFLTGQGVSLFGSMLVHYAVMWHITLKTQSGMMMTLIAAAGTLPLFFISPFGGVWADRYNKKHLINIADASIAVVTLVMAVIFAFGADMSGLLLLCLIMRSLGQGVQTPAVNALVPELVPQEHLTRVNGINGSIQSIVMFASPMAGGALLAVAPIQILMFIDVVTAAIGIAILYFFVKMPAKEMESEQKAGAGQYFHDIREGLRYIGKHAMIKKFLIISAAFNFLIAPTAVLTSLQVVRNWGSDVWSAFGGISFGPEQRLASVEAMFFVGMILGGLVISAWGGFKNKSHTMALTTCMQGIGTIGLGLLTNFWVYLICISMNGMVMGLFNPPMMSVIQTNVDAAYMGRVFSVLMMMGNLVMPLGMVLWGPLGDVIAIDWLLIGTGVFLFALGFVFLADKVLLQAGAPKEKTPGDGE
jgi:DHA3 family macrolide efflux protein-like MFS transporter